MVAACLRLGCKYEITHLRTEALRRLCHDYPSTLEQWDRVHDIESRAIDREISAQSSIVVGLARETNNLSFLPIALYYACCNPYRDIAFGRTRPDGTVIALSTRDRMTCIVAKERIIELQATESFRWLWSSGPSSCSRPSCIERKAHLLKEYWTPLPRCMALRRWSPRWERGMCANCVTTAMEQHAAGRQKIWNLLPSIFELPPWGQLHDRLEE